MKQKAEANDNHIPAWVKIMLDEDRKRADDLLQAILASRKEERSGPKAYGLPSGKRVAFVVGVNTYSKLGAGAQLRTAKGDATAIGETLKSMGFEVTAALDADRGQFYEKWDNFVRSVDTGSTTAFFFAGHGMQVSQVNYLLPADTPGVDVANDGLLRKMAIDFNQLRGGSSKSAIPS